MSVTMRETIPALPVQDISRSVAFSRDKLGFLLVHDEAGFAIFRRDAVEIHLWEAADDSWRTRVDQPPVVSGAESFIAGTASCRIGVTGIDELHVRLQPWLFCTPTRSSVIVPGGRASSACSTPITTF